SSLAPADVTARWEAYHASTPALALGRARQVLQPPDGTTLELKDDGTLSVSGTPPLPWLADASRIATLIPGITRVETGSATDASLRGVGASVESLSPVFAKGQATLSRGQEGVLQQLVDRTAELARAAAILGRRFRVTIVGHTDADGPPEANVP